MIPLGQVKVGTKIIFRDAPFEIIESNHLKMGRGGAKLVTKMRNLLTQATIDYTFAGDEKLEEANLGYRAAQYLYRDNKEASFMAADDFETLALTLPENRTRFLSEGEKVDLLIWNNQPIDIKLPTKVTLEISYTEPGFKGNTASSTLKPATLATGAQITVPLFINIGDNIVVNTVTGEYVSRA